MRFGAGARTCTGRARHVPYRTDGRTRPSTRRGGWAGAICQWLTQATTAHKKKFWQGLTETPPHQV